MSESGLQVASNPSELFLSEEHSDSEVLAGLAVAAIMDGSRTFLIEIQVALLNPCFAPSCLVWREREFFLFFWGGWGEERTGN